jgi:DNA-binding NarL/FixJ family response regulator
MPGVISRATPDGSSAAGAAAPRILVVEDDFFVALDVEHWMREAGYEVVGIAASADDAIALARDTRPDLAIVDIRILGPKDGVETAIDLYSQFGVRSVFASAQSDTLTRKRAQPAQPLGWLSKPYSGAELIALLRHALEVR